MMTEISEIEEKRNVNPYSTRFQVRDGILYAVNERIGTVDVWKKDGLSQGPIFLDLDYKIIKV